MTFWLFPTGANIVGALVVHVISALMFTTSELLLMC